MSAGVPWASLAVVLLAGAGFPYARLLGLQGPMLPAGAWLLGCGLAAGSMLGLSAAHVPFSRASLGASWLVIIACGIGLCRIWPGKGIAIRSVQKQWSAPSDLVSVVSVGLCCFQLSSVALAAVRVPLGSFDAWALWDFKGVRFWHDGAVTHAFLNDQATIFAHPAYPPLLPLLIAWVYTWCGQADPVLMKPLFPLFYAALLLAFAACLRTCVGWRPALVGTACLALVPRITDYAATGLADVPLAAYLVAGAALFAGVARGHAAARYLPACGVFAGLAACTKHEGLVFLGVLAITLVLVRCSWHRVALTAGASALVALPWYLWAAAMHLPDRDFLPATPANLLHFAGRLPAIASLFALNMLSLAEWGVLWMAVAAVLLYCLITRRARLPVLLLPVLLPLAAYVVSLSLSAWPDYLQHARTSLDRLMLATVPFALWWLIVQFVPLERAGPASGAGAVQTATDS